MQTISISNNINDKVVKLQAKPSDTIGSIIPKIQKLHGTESHECKLMFNDQEMDYNKTLSDYGILEMSRHDTGEQIVEWSLKVLFTTVFPKKDKK